MGFVCFHFLRHHVGYRFDEFYVRSEENNNLVRLDGGLERSSTVVEGDNKNNKLGRIKGHKIIRAQQ